MTSSSHFLLEGVFTPIWTPASKEGHILHASLEEHARLLLDRGVRGIVAFGSTGQYPFFSAEERIQATDMLCASIGPESLLVNISATRPQEVRELACHIAKTQVRAILLLPPAYYAYTQEDIAHYAIETAKLACRPLILYNYPECVRNRYELETIERIASEVELIGIKQSGKDFDYIGVLAELGKKVGFSVVTGDEVRLDEALTIGAKGSIGGLSNVLFKEVQEVYEAYQKGDKERVRQKKREIQDIARNAARLSFPLNIQALMEAKGMEVGAPKIDLSPSTLLEYGDVVASLKELFSSFDTKGPT